MFNVTYVITLLPVLSTDWSSLSLPDPKMFEIRLKCSQLENFSSLASSTLSIKLPFIL